MLSSRPRRRVPKSFKKPSLRANAARIAHLKRAGRSSASYTQQYFLHLAADVVWKGLNACGYMLPTDEDYAAIMLEKIGISSRRGLRKMALSVTDLVEKMQDLFMHMEEDTERRNVGSR